MPHFKSYVAVYLLLENSNGDILFSQRHNTGFKDGYWSLVAGHLDGGEDAKQALIREAKEEAGITIQSTDLLHVHTQHRLTPDREYIDLYFSCNKWQGEITNMEPNKCSGLAFHSLENLQIPLVEYLPSVLQEWKNGSSYSSYGFRG